MAAGTYDLVIEQGATLEQEFIWRNPDKTAINNTGYTARMQVRETISSATILADLTTVNAKIVLGDSHKVHRG